MSATFSTQRQHHVPLVAALVVAGVIAAAGAVGVALENNSSAPADTPALRTPTAQDYSKYNYYHGPNAPSVKQQQHSFQSPPGGKTQLGQ